MATLKSVLDCQCTVYVHMCIGIPAQICFWVELAGHKQTNTDKLQSSMSIAKDVAALMIQEWDLFFILQNALEQIQVAKSHNTLSLKYKDFS